MEGLKCPVCFMGKIEKIQEGYYKCPDCEEEYLDRYAAKEACDKMMEPHTLKEKAKALFSKFFPEDEDDGSRTN